MESTGGEHPYYSPRLANANSTNGFTWPHCKPQPAHPNGNNPKGCQVFVRTRLYLRK